MRTQDTLLGVMRPACMQELCIVGFCCVGAVCAGDQVLLVRPGGARCHRDLAAVGGAADWIGCRGW